MNQSIHNSLVSFIWSIADGCLRDIYVRGKYRDVILPMVVLRRLDSLLEATKDKVFKAEADLSQILHNYLYIFTNSAIFDIWKSFIFNKATIENIGADKYANLPVIVPPLDEQQAIADYLDNVNGKTEKAIALKKQEIERLKEYRQSLINSAVTGKIKI